METNNVVGLSRGIGCWNELLSHHRHILPLTKAHFMTWNFCILQWVPLKWWVLNRIKQNSEGKWNATQLETHGTLHPGITFIRCLRVTPKNNTKFSTRTKSTPSSECKQELLRAEVVEKNVTEHFCRNLDDMFLKNISSFCRVKP